MILHRKEIIFLGYNNIIDCVSTKLIDDGLPVSIVTNKKQYSKISKSCLQSKTTVLEDKDKLLSYINNLKNINNYFFISVGCPWILDQRHFDKLKHNIYNLHGTHLPKYRGGTIFSWQILTGNRLGICLLHRMKNKIDSGPIISFDEFIYPPSCHKPIDYIQFYDKKNIDFLYKTLLELQNENNEPTQIKQPEYLSSYWPRLRSDVNGWIDWSWTALEIERFICAFDEPYEGARCRLNNSMVIIKDVFSQSSDGYTHPIQYGIIYRNNKKWINVAANGGEIIIKTVLDENGKNILPDLNLGDRFFSNFEELDFAKKRLVKSSSGLIIKD